MTTESINAKILALENAAAMIREHGSEGGQFQEDYSVSLDIYYRECKKVSKKLYLMAEKLKIKPAK